MLLLPPSSGRRWRAAPEVGFALFRLRPTPCPSGIPLPWEGGRWATHPASPSSGRWEIGFLPLLPPSFGRRWRVAPEVGFALFRLRPTPAHPASPSFLWKEVARSAGGWLSSFRLRPTPALRASPFHGKGVDGLLIHSSTLHYPFTENGFQILATFIELKMNLKIGQSHYF